MPLSGPVGSSWTPAGETPDQSPIVNNVGTPKHAKFSVYEL